MAFKTYSPSKAQQMRAAAAKIQERGETPTPKLIIAEMAKKGITISSGHASVVLRKFTGKRLSKRRRRNTHPGVNGHANGQANGQASGHAATLFERLGPTAKFVKGCGGLARARANLDALETLVRLVK